MKLGVSCATRPHDLAVFYNDQSHDRYSCSLFSSTVLITYNSMVVDRFRENVIPCIGVTNENCVTN